MLKYAQILNPTLKGQYKQVHCLFRVLLDIVGIHGDTAISKTSISSGNNLTSLTNLGDEF